MMLELECIDPELRARYFEDYVQHTLSPPDTRIFQQHLTLCFKCQEDIDEFAEETPFLQWVAQSARSASSVPCSDDLNAWLDRPLPVQGLRTYDDADLWPAYHDQPFQEQLAAAARPAGQVIFPITVDYLKDQVVGQFWNRLGQLSFRLDKGRLGSRALQCVVRYAPSDAPDALRTFVVREGEEKLLGPLQEFAPTLTLPDILAALKQFQVVIHGLTDK